MRKTLLLVFIHGFKGGESTFGEDYQFTEDLRVLIAEALPKIDVKTLVYPKFETRGDLGACVNSFRNWLEEKVIDLEVEAGTQSPTVEPSVRTILVGHSMGGIVAAETAIGLASDKPIYSEDGIEKADDAPAFDALMFPYIQGVLAFDTPYLGISPGVVAHGAEGHYQTAASAMSQLGGLGALWGGTKAAQSTTGRKQPIAALPPTVESRNQSSGGAWGNWGKMAMYAGAAGAVAAGGAAAWMNRDHITEGWGWATSHLAFVGCLGRAEELRKRVAFMTRLGDELDVGFANLYTRLGKAAPSKEISMVGTVLGKNRTFCNLPAAGKASGEWLQAVNDQVDSETSAHMSMFEPKENPGYDQLAQDATTLVAKWLQNDWYESSADDMDLLE